MEIESDCAIAFLDVIFFRKGTKLATKVHRQPTHSGRYQNFKSNHPPHVKIGLIQILHNRASTISQERQDLFNKISSLRRDLQLNSYPQGFIDSIITHNSKGSSCPNTKEKPLGSVFISYVKGVSEKFKRIGNRYTIRMIFKTKDTLRISLIKTRPERDTQPTAQYVYSIPCECGRSYIDEKGRPLAVWVC
jgi:hypothetical protein